MAEHRDRHSAPTDASFCTLSSSDYADRARWVREELLPHATNRIETATGMDLLFPDRERFGATLRDFVEHERSCCAGPVRFETRREPEGWVLEVTGARLQGSTLEIMPPERARRAAGLRRLLAAGGVGAVGSLALFCGVPLAVAALGGAAAAAPLLRLDHPLVIGTGAVALSLGVWAYWRRREPS